MSGAAASIHADPRPYLTIISALPGRDARAAASLLAGALRLDVATLALRLAADPPAILGQFDAADVAAAIERIEAAGGDAFACTLADLAALGPTHRIRDLRVEEGRVAVELWRGGSALIRNEEIRVLVRAHLRRTAARRTRPVPPPTLPFARPGLFGVAAGHGLGGAMGAARVFEHAYLARVRSAAERVVTTSDKLDLHTADGRVYQIDGDKFGYRALGELRGYGDRQNMDRMCELLAHLAPDEIVDPYFSLWRAPAGFERLRLPGAGIDRDDPAFAFYSRWAALMYRHLTG